MSKNKHKYIINNTEKEILVNEKFPDLYYVYEGTKKHQTCIAKTKYGEFKATGSNFTDARNNLYDILLAFKTPEKRDKTNLKSSEIKNTSAIQSNVKKIIDPMTDELKEKYKAVFVDDKYTVYLVEKGITLNFKIVEAKKVIIYLGTQDANGYAQGQLVEETASDANPGLGTVSNDSPIGKELVNSYVGYKFTVYVEDKNEHYKSKQSTYIVLNVPKVRS